MPEINIPFTDFNFANIIVPFSSILCLILFFKEELCKFFSKFLNNYYSIFYFFLLSFYFVVLNLTSPYPLTSLKYTLKILEYLPVFILALLIGLFKTYYKNLLFLVIFLIAIILNFFNLILFFNPDLYKTIFYERPYTYPRAQSLVGHPNSYAFFINLSLIVALVLLNESLISNNIFNFYFILSGLNLVLTGSKNNFILFIFLALYILYGIYKKNKFSLDFKIILIFLILNIFLFWLFWLSGLEIIQKFSYNSWYKQAIENSLSQFFKEHNIITYKITSINFREEIYSYALYVLSQFPLGVGPYVFQAEFLSRNVKFTAVWGENTKGFNAHNLVLQVWLDFGILWVVILWSIIILIFRLNSPLKLFFIVVLLGNIVDYFLTNPLIFYISSILIGFSLSEVINEKNFN